MARALAIAGLLGFAALAAAKSPFDGTWRPDPQRPAPNTPPDVVVLAGGNYRCDTCKPPISFAADGSWHAVVGNPYFDSVSVTIIDDHSIRKTARKGGQPAIDTVATVSADGKTLTEQRSLYGMGPPVLAVTSKSTRVAPGPAGAHAISGSWKMIESDLTNHDEDTTFVVKGDALAMTDKMGRSFTAKLDGTDAPYNGDPEFDSVSLKVNDERSIDESDKKDGKVVKISRWKIDPDGKTMHVEFDDTHGHLQHQDGHKVP